MPKSFKNPKRKSSALPTLLDLPNELLVAIASRNVKVAANLAGTCRRLKCLDDDILWKQFAKQKTKREYETYRQVYLREKLRQMPPVYVSRGKPFWKVVGDGVCKAVVWGWNRSCDIAEGVVYGAVQGWNILCYTTEMLLGTVGWGAFFSVAPIGVATIIGIVLFGFPPALILPALFATALGALAICVVLSDMFSDHNLLCEYAFRPKLFPRIDPIDFIPSWWDSPAPSVMQARESEINYVEERARYNRSLQAIKVRIKNEERAAQIQDHKASTVTQTTDKQALADSMLQQASVLAHYEKLLKTDNSDLHDAQEQTPCENDLVSASLDYGPEHYAAQHLTCIPRLTGG